MAREKKTAEKWANDGRIVCGLIMADILDLIERETLNCPVFFFR